MREDYLAAPLFGIFFHNGSWVAVLDPAPNGATTMTETTAQANITVIDEQIQFGALGAGEVPGGGIDIGFWLPGTTKEFPGRFFGGEQGVSTPSQVVRHRYHPVKEGFTQNYQVAFRFGNSEFFRDMERDSWRWAWESLKPKVTTY